MRPITKRYLDQIKKRMGKITRTWEVIRKRSENPAIDDIFIFEIGERGRQIARLKNDYFSSDPEATANAEFIVNAREDILNLIAHIEKVHDYYNQMFNGFEWRD